MVSKAFDLHWSWFQVVCIKRDLNILMQKLETQAMYCLGFAAPPCTWDFWCDASAGGGHHAHKEENHQNQQLILRDEAPQLGQSNGCAYIICKTSIHSLWG